MESFQSSSEFKKLAKLNEPAKQPAFQSSSEFKGKMNVNPAL